MMQNKKKPQCQAHSSVHVGVIATESFHSCLAWKMSNHQKEVICLSEWVIYNYPNITQRTS